MESLLFFAECVCKALLWLRGLETNMFWPVCHGGMCEQVHAHGFFIGYWGVGGFALFFTESFICACMI